jgi:hypothetical protein
MLPLKRYKIALGNYFLKKKKINEKHRYFLFDLTQFLISKKFEKKLCSKVLFSLGSGSGTGSGLSKNAGSGSVLNQSGSTTLLSRLLMMTVRSQKSGGQSWWKSFGIQTNSSQPKHFPPNVRYRYCRTSINEYRYRLSSLNKCLFQPAHKILTGTIGTGTC